MIGLSGLVALLINLLVLLIVLGVFYWIASLIISGIAAPWSGVAIKILGIVCLLIILLWFLAAVSGQAPYFIHYQVR